jgi:secreted trypsin-like serine protease
MKACPIGEEEDEDVSLLPTEPLGSSVVPAKLADTATINSATAGRLIGFGYSKPGADEDTSWGTRRYADIPIVSNACSGEIKGQPDSAYYGCTKDFELVAISPKQADQCDGDSGAPMFLVGKDGASSLLAVTSRAIKHGECGDGGVYERVDGAVGAWITEQVAKASH